MNKGKIIVISGPSGVGKHTIFEKVLDNKELNLSYSVSMTTRKKRRGETEGVDYYYVSEDEFNNAIKNNELIEWAEFCGNKYGTPKKNLLDKINQGINVILEIEVIGANNVFKMFDDKDILSIFILPPSVEALAKRLKSRGSETDDIINKRVERAKEEINERTKYQHNVVNDNLNKCVNEIISIIKKYTN